MELAGLEPATSWVRSRRCVSSTRKYGRFEVHESPKITAFDLSLMPNLMPNPS